MQPTNAENDVSENELKLRKLDHRDKLMRAFEVVVLAAVVAITMFALINIRQLANENRKNIDEHRSQIEDNNSDTNKQVNNRADINQAKLDTILCIISVSPTVRTSEYVKSCYDRIEKSSGLKLERFGDGVHAQ